MPLSFLSTVKYIDCSSCRSRKISLSSDQVQHAPAVLSINPSFHTPAPEIATLLFAPIGSDEIPYGGCGIGAGSSHKKADDIIMCQRNEPAGLSTETGARLGD